MEVRFFKTSEKIIIWMRRNEYSQEYIASKLGITRQTLAKRIKDDFFSPGEIIHLKQLGFKD